MFAFLFYFRILRYFCCHIYVKLGQKGNWIFLVQTDLFYRR